MNHSSVKPKTVMVDNITTTIWSGSCCCCYVFYHYCLMFDRGVVHAVVVILSTITVLGKTEKWFILLLLYCLQLLFKVWERSGSYCCCYNVYHYCFRFDRGVVHFVLVILSTITAQGLTEEWFMLLLLYCLPLLFYVWQRSGSCCWCYIVYLYWLRFSLLCQTLSSNGRQYNSNNMNHSSVIPKTVMGDNITTTIWTTPLSNLKQ
jgi:hypothetical protein